MWPFHKHEWMTLGSRAIFRTCCACQRIEQGHGDHWRKVSGVTSGNWPIIVRHISLDGCDSLAEHREMLAARHG